MLVSMFCLFVCLGCVFVYAYCLSGPAPHPQIHLASRPFRVSFLFPHFFTLPTRLAFEIVTILPSLSLSLGPPSSSSIPEPTAEHKLQHSARKPFVMISPPSLIHVLHFFLPFHPSFLHNSTAHVHYVQLRILDFSYRPFPPDASVGKAERAIEESPLRIFYHQHCNKAS
ncbi:MAG: hypothetical protein JOS17DRAFT_740144 [Linnemannia elongata]|nr:MAG: hypothetical protein JOS17DRAFT_740144 [Linnemannia elongata]